MNREYLRNGNLRLDRLGRGTARLDTGTHDSLLDAGEFVGNVEERQGLKIACVEEFAYRMGYIDKSHLASLAEPHLKTGYGQYLLRLLEGGPRP